MNQTDLRPTARDHDDRKSAAIAMENLEVEPGAKVIGSFPFARELLRSADMPIGGYELHRAVVACDTV